MREEEKRKEEKREEEGGQQDQGSSLKPREPMAKMAELYRKGEAVEREVNPAPGLERFRVEKGLGEKY